MVTRAAAARVLAHEILAHQLLVETEDHRRVLVPAGDVLTILSRRTDIRDTSSDEKVE